MNKAKDGSEGSELEWKGRLPMAWNVLFGGDCSLGCSTKSMASQKINHLATTWPTQTACSRTSHASHDWCVRECAKRRFPRQLTGAITHRQAGRQAGTQTYRVRAALVSIKFGLGPVRCSCRHRAFSVCERVCAVLSTVCCGVV